MHCNQDKFTFTFSRKGLHERTQMLLGIIFSSPAGLREKTSRKRENAAGQCAARCHPSPECLGNCPCCCRTVSCGKEVTRLIPANQFRCFSFTAIRKLKILKSRKKKTSSRERSNRAATSGRRQRLLCAVPSGDTRELSLSSCAEA